MTLLTDGAKYETMPSMLGALSVHQVLDPAHLVARLRITDNSLGATWSYEFRPGSRRTTARWLSTGRPPVVWHFVPATRHRRPILLIALYRDAQMVSHKTRHQFTQFHVRREPVGPFAIRPRNDPGRTGARGRRNEHPRHHRASDWHGPGFPPELFEYDQVDLTPEVTVLRVQNPHLMPRFDQPQSIPSGLGPAHLILAGQEAHIALGTEDIDPGGALTLEATTRFDLRREWGWRSGMLVLPHPRGVLIRSLQQAFEVAITIKRPERPAAFAYRAVPAGAANVVFVHHDDNVDVTVQVADNDEGLAFEKGLFVFHREDAAPYLVPTQGQEIEFSRDLFRRVDNGRSLLADMRLGLAQLVVETLISAIPIVGDLYELGQLCFMYETGRDFWGQRVSSEEILLYGSLAAVTIAGPVAFRLGRTALRRRRTALASLADALDAASDPLDGALIDAAPAPRNPDLLHRVNSLPDETQDVLAHAVLASVVDGDARSAVRAIGDALEKAKATATPERLADLVDHQVAALFTADMASFSNPTLRFEYERYLRTRTAGLPADPVSWIQLTRSPWIDAYLAQMFGPRPKAVVHASLARAAAPSAATMTHEMIDLYDRIVSRGVLPYGELEKLAKTVPHFRRFFQLDHIVEQRFIAGYVTWSDTLPTKQAFMTFLVPTNSGAAAVMVSIDETSHLIRYVHEAKTTMMRQRIAHGAEHLYSVQQITDATLFTLKSLGADQAIAFRRLTADFNYLALVRNQPRPRIRALEELTEDLFLPANGWPEARRIDGVFQLIAPST